LLEPRHLISMCDCRPSSDRRVRVDTALDALHLAAMRAAWTVVLGLVTVACGGRVEADKQTAASPDAAPEVDATPAVDSPSPVVDASVNDTSDEIDCGPSDAGGSTCTAGSYCVAWVGADASVPQSQFPSDVLRSACEMGPAAAACGGERPLSVKYNPYDNEPAWVVCAEP
jgi:hypothetical protein